VLAGAADQGSAVGNHPFSATKRFLVETGRPEIPLRPRLAGEVRRIRHSFVESRALDMHLAHHIQRKA
jgi:hypothetical protein